jgi:hypothetical protein
MSGRDRGSRGPGPTDRGDSCAPRKRRRGLPDEASILSETTFTSPKGKRYRILKTTETDAYDPPEKPGRKHR